MIKSKRDKYKKVIANRIRWLRCEVLKMTQLELALALDLSAQHLISDYESGLIRPGYPRAQQILKLVKQMGVTHDPNGTEINYQYIRPDQH